MRLAIILYWYRIGDLVLDLVRVLVCLKVEEEEERERERKEGRLGAAGGSSCAH